MNGPKQFRKRFEGSKPFEATAAAEAWLEARGFSVGTMCGGEPRAILLGSYDIAKWRNLSPREINMLHGTLTGDHRNGPVEIGLTDPQAVDRVESEA